MKYKLYLWQNIISPHQSDLIQALASHAQVESLTLIVENDSDQNRINMGWDIPVLDKVKIISAPEESVISSLIKENQKGDVHVFSGLSAYPIVQKALRNIRKNGCLIGVMSETGNWQGIAGKLRILKGNFERVQLEHKIDFILTIGRRGEWWYKKLGFSATKIFRFAYFSKVAQQEPLINTTHQDLKFIFVGRLIPVKGLKLLIQTLGKRKRQPWCLKIIGNGVEQESLQSLVQVEGLSEKVTFHDFIPFDKVQQEYKQHDVLVLPSIGKDGWGMVINEALLAGLRVLVSSNCGASELVENNHFLGYSVNANEIELGAAIDRLLLERNTQRQEISNWASMNLSGSIGAQYMINVLDHLSNSSPSAKPKLNWLS